MSSHLRPDTRRQMRSYFLYLNIPQTSRFLYFYLSVPNGFPSSELEETTRASPYHVAEHHPTRPESLQPYTERSSRSGSEPPSVKADVYVWRYALLVVHARKEEESCLTSDDPIILNTWPVKLPDRLSISTFSLVTAKLPDADEHVIRKIPNCCSPADLVITSWCLSAS